jgi:hypothetical protein
VDARTDGPYAPATIRVNPDPGTAPALPTTREDTMSQKRSLLRNVALLGAMAVATPLLAPKPAEASPITCVTTIYDDGIACAVCVQDNCYGAACSDGNITVSTGGCVS